ncbi:DUF3857 domain-containing protein [Alteromonas sp. AMM-1]|uniref:DUF3857 domain-containing protein n=1 Tax=Alteromonas sp. AMM-1 TaxID=3394233 RepID=UPI0039A6CB37
MKNKLIFFMVTRMATRLSGLVALMALCASGQAAALSKTALTAKAKEWMAASESYSSESLTKVYTDVSHTIYQDKIVTQVTKAWFYPTKALVQESGYETLNFNQYSEVVSDINAFSIAPDGRITWVKDDNIKEIEDDSYNIFTDGKRKVISFPGLQDKGISVLSFTLTHDRTKGIEDWSQTHFPQQFSPVNYYRLSVNSADGSYFNHNIYNDVLTCNRDAHTLLCEGNQLPALVTKDNVNWLDQIGQIVVTTTPDWNGMISRVNRGFKQAMNSQSKVAETLQGLITKDMSTQQKISAIHEFAARDIRYVSMSDNGHAIVPHTVDETIYNRYGDCKDKTVVLVAMLNAIGLKAYPVLVSTDRTSLAPVALPGMNYFDHAVACFELNGEQFCLDATDAYSDWYYLSDWIQGHVSLPLTPDAQPALLPQSEFRWQVTQSTDIRYTTGGGQTEQTTVIFKDEYASSMRGNLASKNSEEQNKWLTSVYEDVVASGVEPVFDISGVDSISEPVTVKSTTEFAPYFDVAEEFVLTEYDAWVRYELGLMKLSEAPYGYAFPGLQIGSTYNLYLPTGWRVQSPPAKLKLQTRFGELTRAVRLVKSNQLEVTTSLTMPHKALADSDIDEFNDVLDVFVQESSINFKGVVK